MTTTETSPSRPAQGGNGRPSGGGDRGALVRLLVVVAGGVVAAYLTGVTQTVLVVVAIVVMIMLHELGHFATAKWSGMKVTEYFLGFGPKLWSVRRGETEYGVKAIPAGGYVKIIGMSNLETVDPADEARTYRQQPFRNRLAVAVAGSTVHFILAFLLLWSIFAVVGLVDYDKPQLQIGSISRLATGPSPAQQAGLAVGDKLVAVDHAAVANWDAVTSYIRKRPGRTIVFTVQRGQRRLELPVVPADLAKVDPGPNVATGKPSKAPRGYVGIGATYPVVKAGPIESLGKATTGLGRASVDTVKALGAIFSPSGASSYGRQLVGDRGDQAQPGGDDPRFLSPVGFVRVASQAADTGWREVLTLLFSINVFVGLFNMIPLLPLDGGHVAIATYERIRSRRGHRYQADIAKVMPIYYAVFLLIVFIGVSSLYLDVVKPLSNPFQ
ncbi:MAG: M50 family metallopeptidase [Acidimicrobiales bacterium]